MVKDPDEGPLDNPPSSAIDADEAALAAMTAIYDRGYTAGESAGYTKGWNDALAACQEALTSLPIPAATNGKLPPETPIEALGMSVRATMCLRRAGWYTIQALTEHTEGDLWNVRSFGQKSIDEAKQKLAEHGYALRIESPPAWMHTN